MEATVMLYAPSNGMTFGMRVLFLKTAGWDLE